MSWLNWNYLHGFVIIYRKTYDLRLCKTNPGRDALKDLSTSAPSVGIPTEGYRRADIWPVLDYQTGRRNIPVKGR